MHFGLDAYLGYVLYAAGVAAVLASLFWRPIVGLFYLLPLLPLQTIRYRMNDLPLGGSVIGIVVLCVALGVLRRGQPLLPKTPWTRLLVIYGVFTYASLCLGAVYLGTGFPFFGDPRFGYWQEYMIMPALLLLVPAVQPTRRQMMALVLVMCLSALMLDRNFSNEVSGRDFSKFSNDLRDVGGNMGYAGTNGLAAFEAQFATFLLALAAFERRHLLRLGYYALSAFSVVCLMYSLSRGGYAALFAGCLFLGVVKQRKLLVLMTVFLLIWTFIVPQAVTERVAMTQQDGELDHSAELRLTLWEDAVQMIDANVLAGTGFNTYAYLHRVGQYEDTHNLLLKVLVETGVLGLLLFLWFVVKTFRTGYRLFRRSKDPFFASLGLGLAGWVVAAMAANCFGDRWTYLQVAGYMWVIAGLVARALALENTAATDEASATAEAGAIEEPQIAAAV
ncbi:MAG: O-antigen ligase family protein [Bryobacteraceae bacterium]|jgi:O-antigen ligase